MGMLLAALTGLVIGAAVVLLVLWLRRQSARDLARQLLEQTETRKLTDLQAILNEVKAAFAQLSQQSLAASSEQFLRLAETRLGAQAQQGEAALDARKKLIEETVQQIATRLTEVGTTLQTLEKDRRQDHGSLLQVAVTLRDTTGKLREALANPQRRGQWGERMAEDILRLAGLLEGVNYRRQAATQAGNKPDFTFPLPNDRCVNMDVKFPLPNYLKFLDAPDDAARQVHKAAFLRDVRQRIKEVTTREYIDPAGGTVDYVLVFIPNEQVYGFLHEHDPTLLDDALRQKVVLCSPLTLYAVLAVVRQVAENLRLEQTSREILVLLSAFSKEWRRYTEVSDKLGKALGDAVNQYEVLTTTRTRQLERQLVRIEELRTQKRLELPTTSENPA